MAKCRKHRNQRVSRSRGESSNVVEAVVNRGANGIGLCIGHDITSSVHVEPVRAAILGSQIVDCAIVKSLSAGPSFYAKATSRAFRSLVSF